MSVSRPRRTRGQSHPSVLALLKTCTNTTDAEEAVRQRARELVEEARGLGWSGPPFDPVILAEMRGIKVRPSSHELRQDAFIGMNELGQVEIVWNQNRPATRTRFSIGHEITHTFFPDCFETVRNRECTAGVEGGKDELERLCDVGAAELVMPISEFGSDLASHGTTLDALDLLRDRYQVSREAVCIRSMQLADRDCAVVFFAYRNKPTEERTFAQGAFAFLDRPEPKLRVEFMVASRAFQGRTLPKHKSVPAVSRLPDLCQSNGPGARLGCVETWPEIQRESLRIDAMRIPGSSSDQIRVLVLLNRAA